MLIKDEFGRRYYTWGPDGDPGACNEYGTTTSPTLAKTEEEKDLIGSGVVTSAGWKGHRPVLDIDFPARLVPSSTPGHFHLYLDGITIYPTQYEALLEALCDAGILQQGVVNRFYCSGQTFVRVKPKPPAIAGSK